MKFRKKPVVIEAEQFTDCENPGVGSPMSINKFCPIAKFDPTERVFSIPTLNGIVKAPVGEWIIRGVKGEFYPCKPNIFEATYEPVIESGEQGRG